MDSLRILFICSRNQWRSPTAEALYRQEAGLSIRSAGTSPRARKQVNLADIEWADLVIVMEEHHKRRLRESYRPALDETVVEVLHIEDRYQFMDPELVSELRAAVDPLIASYRP